MRKALIGGPILTHIENKEKTISYYLGLQAGSVNTSKIIVNQIKEFSKVNGRLL